MRVTATKKRRGRVGIRRLDWTSQYHVIGKPGYVLRQVDSERLCMDCGREQYTQWKAEEEGWRRHVGRSNVRRNGVRTQSLCGRPQYLLLGICADCFLLVGTVKRVWWEGI